jgi:hypothetical protein
MVIKPTPVYNSANLAMLMINLSQILMRPVREKNRGAGYLVNPTATL